MVEPPLVRAAQYVRMSTEHQRYSIEYQSATNAAFAISQGLELVRTYADPGISGLTFEKRPGLRQLLSDILSGQADFEVVLVYDVSRWGRFQDPDESAHYEFLCRSAGVSIRYTAEGFTDDGSITASLLKSLKRAMAAEYSRDLSARISRVQEGLAAKGYWMGGPAPYGFRRCATAPDGSRVGMMDRGQQKALVGYRSVLVAGPDSEVATVRDIFRAFVIEGLSIRSITARLNEEQDCHACDGRWTDWRVRKILTNEAYIGTLVIARRWGAIKHRRLRPRSEWKRVPGACPVLVNPKLFDLARANIRRTQRAGTDEQLIDELRDVLARHGRLSDGIIARDPLAHSVGVYVRRFGSLTRAYELAGFCPSHRQRLAAERIKVHKPHRYRVRPQNPTNEAMLTSLRQLYRTHGYLTADLINSDPAVPHDHCYRRRFGSLARAYALVGYSPTKSQASHFNRSG